MTEGNIIYYSKINENGRITALTESAKMAQLFGWSNNILNKDDVALSDIDGMVYLKTSCPQKSSEVKLAEAKEVKHQELKAEREHLRNIEFAQYDDDEFQIRQDDQNNINTFYSVAVAIKAGVIEPINFTIMSATNNSHTFTADQIIELMGIMKLKVEEIYARYWYARDILLANASTEEEVAAIQIPSEL